ncbi:MULTISPECIES: FAD-dependent oxidoreductase [Inquilinus]|uniref:3-(3-hydroxy-phenyl)propionate hydroxylase n=1 Tax=Inquilinus ginsengisoli TaxID=363840 RepID=A0ABU1JP90_9PROT|nr:FAD-dependent oxidoreductase [Inquilinus ginsengisoli]MDR6289365.1 3-(3-hydroxy-phenyl)propionate hydroxylase [Inquilinus ginsengisoli]
MARYAHQPFAASTPPELAGGGRARYPVAIVGAGPVGLAAAIDLALRGVPSVVLDDNDVVSVGSRAICWAKRSLEIFDRLGVGRRMVAKGVTWQVGRLFHRDRELYAFDLLPEPGHRMPAFINLQQYYVEQYLAERCADFPDLIDLRWKNRVVGVARAEDGVRARVETPAGSYDLSADYLLACDGARSAVRDLLGLDFAGRGFEERFLIADVEMKADFPSERWFWFEPPFHAGQSALLHKQPDDIHRIDLQLGPDADPEEERKPERVIPRIRAMVGDRPFELDWVSVYSFQCRRLERFRHGRVIFLGDAAHVVSPFGARGGNGGIQDADNLAWKLALVLQGEAPAALLDSYDEERIRAADENILNSARATAFMTPKSEMERVFRAAVLDLAADHDFARRLVNSGRLSRPCALTGLSLQSPAPAAPGLLAPGVACPDARLADDTGAATFLLDHLGDGFVLLAVGAVVVPGEAGLPVLRVGAGGFGDPEGDAAARYGEALYLIRPDQHVAARLTGASVEDLRAALARARGERL